MNTRSIVFLLTSVGICIGATQLTADEPSQPVAADVVSVEQAADFAEELNVSENCVLCGQSGCFEDVIEQTATNENGHEELGDENDEFVCMDESCDSERIACRERACTSEQLELEEVVGDKTRDLDVEEVGQICEAAALEAPEATAEVAEIVSDEALIEEVARVEDFGERFDEADSAAEELSEAATAVEETVEAANGAEVEGNVDVVESAVTDDAAEIGTAQVSADPELPADIATDNALATEVDEIEPISSESDAAEVATQEAIEELSEQLIAEETMVEAAVEAAKSVEVEDTVKVAETAIEEVVGDDTADSVEIEAVERSSEESAAAEVATQEAIEQETTVEDVATDAGTLPVVAETPEEVSFELEAAEEVQDAAVEPCTVNEGRYIEEQVSEYADIDANEDVTTDATDGVVEIDETLEVVEPLAEESELQATDSASIAPDELTESEDVTVRTIELGGCKIIIQSERQMDDFELLGKLWEAVNQLEAEMD